MRSTGAARAHRCPDCGGPLVYGEGCACCPICGFTRCGYGRSRGHNGAGG